MLLPESECLLVSDFDGTMTQLDFFERVLAQPFAADGAVFWQRYLNGVLSHFDALQAIFSLLPGDEAEVMRIARETRLEPAISAAVTHLEHAGWKVVIASAGCGWYIDRLLEERDVSLQVYANPGSLEAERGLVMHLPVSSPFFSPATGIDKAAVVREALRVCQDVAFAGDGRPDLEPARLVPPHRRFARGWLADALRAEGLEFRRYQRWSDLAGLLTGSTPEWPEEE